MTELNKLNLKTPDLCSENFNKFEQLFPNCVTETQDDSGNVVKTINFDLLKQIVGIENAGGGGRSIINSLGLAKKHQFKRQILLLLNL